MDQIAFRAPEELIKAVDEYQEENDVIRSQAAREIFEAGIENIRRQSVDDRERAEYEAEIEALQEDINDLERENERLNRERRQLLEQRKEHTELVRYAENQRELEQDARERRNAPVWTRAKWWVFGRSEY